MKGDFKVISMLNERLAEEHAAYVQYTVHASKCKNFGYEKLAGYIFKRAEQEKEHAQELIDRILYLEGEPLFAEIAAVFSGDDVVEMFTFDKSSEISAVGGYAELIDLAVANKDFGTRKLAEHILEEEECHLNDIEANIYQITQSGIDNYLAIQIGG